MTDPQRTEPPRTGPLRTGPLRGVNLGGWLVLEPWMTPSVFVGTQAIDEYTFMATPDAARKLRRHHETFITEDDFSWLEQHGIDLIRLPVGYWVLYPEAPYLGAADILDWAMDAAHRHGIKVLLDLHGAPGSQNGRDHSGRVGPRRWYLQRGDRAQTYNTLEELATRYGDHPALWGIELINEPTDWRVWRLRGFHRTAYDRMTRLLHPGTHVIFSDGYLPHLLRGNLRARDDAYPVVIDCHFYQCFFPWDVRRDLPAQLRKARDRRKMIDWMDTMHPVIVGEWSAGLPAAALTGTDEDSRRTQERAFIEAQLEGYSNAIAWCFWSYKTESNDGWNFRHLVESGLFPL